MTISSGDNIPWGFNYCVRIEDVPFSFLKRLDNKLATDHETWLGMGPGVVPTAARRDDWLKRMTRGGLVLCDDDVGDAYPFAGATGAILRARIRGVKLGFRYRAAYDETEWGVFGGYRSTNWTANTTFEYGVNEGAGIADSIVETYGLGPGLHSVRRGEPSGPTCELIWDGVGFPATGTPMFQLNYSISTPNGPLTWNWTICMGSGSTYEGSASQASGSYDCPDWDGNPSIPDFGSVSGYLAVVQAPGFSYY